jgi:hypothetical protein
MIAHKKKGEMNMDLNSKVVSKTRLLGIMVFVSALVASSLLGGVAYAITRNPQPDGDAHPYVGIIVFDIFVPDVGNVPAWRCSGTLISPTVVLVAGHCTDGAVRARVWFDERLQDDDGTFLVPDYPFGGVIAIEGTPHTYPGFGVGLGNGLPGFATGDVGVIVLDEPVFMDEYGVLPSAGLVDTLKVKTDVDLVGYGVQEMIVGLGQPFWTGLRNRFTANAELIASKFVHSNEFVRVTANPGRGTGGFSFGDSGGPVLLEGTNTILAVNSYVTNEPSAGVTYSCRVDTTDMLDWINSFLP